MNEAENTLATHHPKILKALERPLNEDVMEKVEGLLHAIGTKDNFALVEQMKAIVPEYISNNSAFGVLDKK